MPMVLPQPSADVMKEEEDSADDSASPPPIFFLPPIFWGEGEENCFPLCPPPLPFLRCRGGGSLSQLLPLPLLSHPKKRHPPHFSSDQSLTTWDRCCLFARHTHSLYFSTVYMRDRSKKGGGCCSFFGFAVFPLLLCACCIWLCCPDKPHKNSGKRRRRLATTTTTTTPVCTAQYTVYVWRTQPIGSSLRGHRATLSYDLIWPPPPPPPPR